MLVGCLGPALIAAYTDVRRYIVDDRVSISILLAGLAAAILTGRLGDALLGAGIIGGLLLACCLAGGMGGGDLKLGTALGAWFGLNGLCVLLLACVMGVVWGLVKLGRKGRLVSWLRSLGSGLWLRVFYGVRGTVPLGRLPDEKTPAPPEAVPFATCLVAAAWVVFLIPRLW